ncbi:MAG: molybdopterin-dependent oxidoreductase [Acidobacteria bacterium]|nr:molybdopterin-dependent oxidoreductase [Acidobacteriota bacterium]MDW7983142.1 molybdopterin-dependent oxidoreductase [Acidobacteriota bacterium]
MRRRDFLKALGVTATAAALEGCRRRARRLLPYVIPPEDVVPGVAAWYATVCRECPAGCGLLVKTREGRAIKVEGNPAHPVNRGRLCVRGQAALQGLYNPDRIRQPLRKRPSGGFRPLSWEDAERLLIEQLAELRRQGRADRIALITPLQTGSLDHLVQDWMEALGIPRRIIYEPFAYEALRTASRIAFGRDAIPDYRIEAARVLISFGADFLETWLSNVRFARAFVEGVRAVRDGAQVGRFIHVEPRLSLTAANADAWVPIRPGTEAFLALAMIHVILAEGRAAPSLPADEVRRLTEWVRPYDPETVAARTDVPSDRIRQLARLFVEADPGLAIGGSVAGTGSNATATLVAIHLLNYVAGYVGRTVVFGPDSHLGHVSRFSELRDLVAAMGAGQVEALLLLDVNPVFTLPRSLGFEQALAKVPFVAALASFMDETTARAHLVLPIHTPLESWGDYEPQVGVHGLLQPVMRPLFRTRAPGDILLAVARSVGEDVASKLPWPDFYTYLRERWQALHQRLAPDRDFEAFWQDVLRQGGVWETVPSEPVRLTSEVFQTKLEPLVLEGPPSESWTLLVYPSLHHFDGRGANRPWLQEIPDPVTKVVWDAWVEVHPETARRLSVAMGDVVELASPYGKIELPVYVYEGLRPDVVAVPIGQGHTQYGRYAQARGANPIELLSPRPEAISGGRVWLSVRVRLTKTGRRYPLVSTAARDRQLGRGIARVVTVEEVHPSVPERPVPDMYPKHEHPGYRWGMVIDLNACIGCNACVAACYAENNIPVVGKAEVALRREMAWIRVERYLEAVGEYPDVRFVPMLCQHCDNAPCEPVCPVYATYHNPEGLNAMVYNQCVGTRYCANNCPYKVRCFNWLDPVWPDPLHLQLNPDVTVRSKGVVEKCTFCIQRIQAAKDQAKDEGRPLRDGDVVPACAQTCPTDAIVFGDLNDPESRVARLARDPRGYHVLAELNTRPAVTYLKKFGSWGIQPFRNPAGRQIGSLADGQVGR